MEGTEVETIDGLETDVLKTNNAYIQLIWALAAEAEEDDVGTNTDDSNANGAPDADGGQAENNNETGENALAPGDFAYELERADNPNFEEPVALYQGRDRASFQPGLAEGEYYYRVRAVDDEGATGEWSRPLYVQVEYQSMTLAVSLFALGGVVFLATLVLVISGTIADKKEREAEAS